MAFGASGGPRFDFRLTQPVIQLNFLVTGPQGSVRGFSWDEHGSRITQPATSRVAASLQTLYDAMPPEEQLVLASILA